MIPNYNSSELSTNIAKAYLESLRDHIRFVQEAGSKLAIIVDQLLIHDDSKFSQAEFTGYALHFKGGGACVKIITRDARGLVCGVSRL